MSNAFSDDRADAAFLDVAKAIAAVRNARPDYTNEEMAYALLQTCACIDDQSVEWFCFLHEALNDCINHECGE